MVQRKEVPEEMPVFTIPIIHPAATTMVDIPYALASTAQVSSLSEGRRLIKQGAVEIDGKKISANSVEVRNGSVIKVGKRRFVKVINTDKIA